MKWGPLLTAIALGAFVILRRRKLEPTLLVGGAIAAVGLLVYGLGAFELPNFEKLVEDAGEVLGKWTYLVVAVAAFLETGAFVGLIAPGETFMVFGGVVAGQGRIDLIALIAITWAAAVAGDVTSFYLGRRLGRAFLVKHGPKVSITEERLHTVERFFARHGGKAILIGRFVGLVRAIAPFLAGSSGMAFKRFIPYDIIGAGAWATTFLVLGYVFWQRFAEVLNYAEKGAFWLGSTIVVVVGVMLMVRWLRVEENRHRLRAEVERAFEQPVLRPLGRVLRPLWRWSRRPRRFVVDRITPGALGLEFTTLAAVACVGSFAYVGYVIVLQDTALTGGDRQARDMASDLYAAWLVDVAKVITALGSLVATGAAVLVTSAVLALRGRRAEAVTLVAAMILLVVAVHVTKGAMDRPRPPEPLVDTDGSSFPSAHAAYAVAWVAVAVALVRTIPGVARMTLLVAASVVLAVVIGATRLYLRAHELSDVLGGFGLGAMIFALCAMAAMAVTHIRHDPLRRASSSLRERRARDPT